MRTVASIRCRAGSKPGLASHNSSPGRAGLEPAPTVPLADVLREIGAYPVPKGVSADAWGKLTAELKRLLVARAGGQKKIAVGPTDASNAVTDLAADADAERTQATLTWTEVFPGDCDNNGVVDITDLQPMALHYGETSSGPGSPAYLADANGDGTVGIDDLQPVALNYSAHLQGYLVWRGHWNGASTDWEATARPNSNAANSEWSADRPSPPPVSTRPAYTYTDDISALIDKDNIRYKVCAYGDGAEGAESNEAAVPALPPPTYTVSGTVLEGTTPLPGVTMTLTPGGLTAATQSDGTYSIPGVLDGTYTLTPSKTGAAFTPASLSVVVFGADVPGQDFTAAQPHTISGTIQESGTGLGGVVVTPTPGPLTVTTQPDGTYSIADVAYGTYTLVPRNLQYAFTPPARSVVVTSADVSGQDFAGAGGLPALAWPKFHANLKNTGLSPYVGAQTSGLRWLDTLMPDSLDQESPAIGPDGTIYIGYFNGSTSGVYAFSPSDGSIKWSALQEDGDLTCPAVSADGTVYVGVGSAVGHAYALDPLDGSVKWRQNLNRNCSSRSSPAIGPDGTVYFGSSQGGVYALNPADGSVIRQMATGSIIESSPAIADDGTLYVGCDDNNLYAFNTVDGSLKWKYLTGGHVATSPAIGADGTVYIGTGDKNVYAVDPDGSLKWQYGTGDWVSSSPAIGPDGTVYVGSNDGSMYAFNPADGSLRWKYSCGDTWWLVSSPAVGADGTVYFACDFIDNNYVYALNGADGGLKWSYSSFDSTSSPAIGADGTVYLGAGAAPGKMYAFFP